jgi:hypothetical protein
MSFVLIFDIPAVRSVEKVRINRMLHRIGAKKIQDSFWKHENLKLLIEIASQIKNIGGKASILEEKILF